MRFLYLENRLKVNEKPPVRQKGEFIYYFLILKKTPFLYNLTAMGYIFEFNDAVAYERWLRLPKNRFTLDLESRLITDMLQPANRETILDIGCGTGSILLFLVNQGLQVTGLDPSPYMLDIAKKTTGNRADLHRGYAEDLPFEDNSFHHACLFTTLEFVNDPQKAIEEACRVAKDKIFIGALNRYAFKGVERRIRGIFTRSIYNRARFFRIWELKRMGDAARREVPVSWKTVIQLPAANSRIIRRLEESSFVHHSPFGAFIGLAAPLVPRFGTRSLPIEYQAKQTPNAIAG